MKRELATKLNSDLEHLDLDGRLAHLAGLGMDVVFTTSLGIEDQIISAAIGTNRLPIRVATLQTERLFDETLTLIEQTRRRYDLVIEEYHPEKADIDAFAAQYGINGFYDSIEARHACCGLRKVKPLGRALAGADVWITGMRRGQSDAREVIPFAEYDGDRDLIKVNPLADWDIEAVRAFVSDDDVPINPLHARGYASIGCEPCTRAIRPGEPERAGRWWWENDDTRECGLHVAEPVAS